jgi:hypothetical protein
LPEHFATLIVQIVLVAEINVPGVTSVHARIQMNVLGRMIVMAGAAGAGCAKPALFAITDHRVQPVIMELSPKGRRQMET